MASLTTLSSVRETVILNRVRWLTAGFWLLFFAYSSAQLLQTSINGSSGYICLSLVYFIFAVAALVAPWLISVVPPNVLIPLSSMPYVFMVGSNMGSDKEGLFVGCASVGIGAASLWSAHGTYLTEAGVALSLATGMPLAKAASIVNATFFKVQFASGGASCLITSVIFLLFEPRLILFFLFAFLTVIGAGGFLILASMHPAAAESNAVFAYPFVSIVDAIRKVWISIAKSSAKSSPLSASVDKGGSLSVPSRVVPHHYSISSEVQEDRCIDDRPLDRADATTATEVREVYKEEPVSLNIAESKSSDCSDASAASASVPMARSLLARPPPPSVLFLLRFMFTDTRMLLLALPVSAVGACMGLINTLWYAAVVADGPGVAYLGFVGAVQSFAGTGSITLWGMLVVKPRIGRRSALICAAILQITFLVASIFWISATSNGMRPSLSLSLTFVICLSATYGFAEGIFMTFREWEFNGDIKLS